MAAHSESTHDGEWFKGPCNGEVELRVWRIGLRQSWHDEFAGEQRSSVVALGAGKRESGGWLRLIMARDEVMRSTSSCLVSPHR